MTYRIIENATETTGLYTLASESGNLARTTNEGRVFSTFDKERAQEAREFLNQTVTGLEKRKGSHWVKSTFGPI